MRRPRRIVERKVTVYLIGRDVMITHIVLTTGLEQAISAHHVGLHEGLRVGDGVVVVGLSGVVNDCVVSRNDAIQELSVANVSHHKLDPILGQASDVLGVAGVGELVEHGHVNLWVLANHMMYEVGANEAAATGDDNVLGLEDLRHVMPPQGWKGTLAAQSPSHRERSPQRKSWRDQGRSAWGAGPPDRRRSHSIRRWLRE